MSEENYFFKLSAFERKLLEFYEANPDFMGPESTRREVISFVRGGLRDLSVSRTSFSWGIPVPGDEKHVIYVWLDALGQLHHRAGLRLRRSGGPGALQEILARGPAPDRQRDQPLPLRLLAGLSDGRRAFRCRARSRANGWLLFDQGKMSKSRGNIVRAETVQEVLGADALRYFLLREIPFGQDGSFSFRCAGAALQRRPRQRLRQPGQPRGQHGAQVLRRRCAGGWRARPLPKTLCAKAP